MKKQKTSMKHLFLFAVLFSLTACSRAPEKSFAVEADLARKATLIAQAKEIEKLDDVGKHVYAPVFIKLARIYAQEKDYRNAISYYQKGISIDSFDSQPLLELAQLYEEMGLYKDAAKRFEQVLSLRPKRTVEDKANEGLARVRPKVLPENVRDSDSKPLTYKDITIYLLPFDVLDKELMESLRVALQSAYGVRFVLLDNTAGPFEGYNVMRNQYFVMPLGASAVKRYADIRSRPGTRAVLIVTSHDIADEDVNFLFGATMAEYDIGVISFARFLEDFPDKVSRFKRIYIQALSTGGGLLGLVRCSTPLCARAYPNSFDEFIRKKTTLCDICRGQLVEGQRKLNHVANIPWSEEDLASLEQVRKKYKLDVQ